jgi:hypothetical protein
MAREGALKPHSAARNSPVAGIAACCAFGGDIDFSVSLICLFADYVFQIAFLALHFVNIAVPAREPAKVTYQATRLSKIGCPCLHMARVSNPWHNRYAEDAPHHLGVSGLVECNRSQLIGIDIQ